MQYEEKCCPLCGKENQCGVADGQDACWCMNEKFPEGIIGAVSNEPKKCICQNCLHTYKNI
ncbi:cysteine-rich CWC family protein [Lysinibacillus sp. NPDC093712]|uniref:cysteine-rich CWC family protein n=1 Tax=Lysinibacillus sp. NPDC093712 TaxID=3390579 RepID=UPI003CFCACE8